MAQAVLAGLAGRAGSVAQAGPAGLAVQVDPAASAVQAGQAASAVLAGQAVQADPAAAPAPRRGPLTVPLGGRTSAGREARPWAV